MRTMILCLGHERWWSDDVAARVGHILKALPLAPVAVQIISRLDWEAVDAISESDQIVVVDALRSGHEPGTCFVEEIVSEHAPTFRLHCRHRQLLGDIVELAHLIAPEEAPKRLVFVGVESGGLPETPDEALPFERARSSVPLAVDSVLRSFGAGVALRRMVAPVCRAVEEGSGRRAAWETRYEGAA